MTQQSSTFNTVNRDLGMNIGGTSINIGGKV